ACAPAAAPAGTAAPARPPGAPRPAPTLPRPAQRGPDTDQGPGTGQGPGTDQGPRTKDQAPSLSTPRRAPIDRRPVRWHEVLLRRLLHVGRRHLVQIAQDGVDLVRIVVVER